MLDRLCNHLAWGPDRGLVAELQASLVDAYCARYERVLQALNGQDPSRAQALTTRMSALPDDAFMAMFPAPETGFRLGYDGAARVADTADYLEASVTAEELRLGLRQGTGAPVWSARGDRYFPAGLHAAARCSSRYDAARPYAAGEVAGMVIDFHSPRALSRLAQISGEAEEIRPRDRQTAVERIQLALAMVERVSPGAWATLRGFTDVIVVRSDPSAPDHYTSASTTLCLKRPVLRNPFVPRATITELADGLIHEAIHCVCDLVEISSGRWIGDPAAEARLKVASPWTGRALDLHTYLQACWVWFGLWSFWLAALDEPGAAADEPALCLTRAYRGFHEGEAVRRLAEAAPGAVRKDLVQALLAAQERVLGEAAALEAPMRRRVPAEA